MASPAIAKTFASADRLANHLAEAPLLIMVTLDPARVAPVTPPGANVFPAVQNLLLAARALGLGATLTTVYRTHEAEVKQLLGIPETVETMALIPIGYPVGKFGPPPALPRTVTYWEKWGGRGALLGDGRSAAPRRATPCGCPEVAPSGSRASPASSSNASRGGTSRSPFDSRAATTGTLR
jgi:hypothetical protein